MSAKKNKNVHALIVLNEKSMQEAKAGIIRYAELHPDWTLRCDYSGRLPSEDEIRALADMPNAGFLVCAVTLPLAPFTVQALQALRKTRCPIVQLDSDIVPAGFPRLCTVEIDNEQIATAAAHHLLTRRFCKSYAFATPCKTQASLGSKKNFGILRFQRFRDILGEHGLGCQLLTPGNEQPVLASMTRPIAVFAANDRRAVEIMSIARQMKLRVPEDLLVIGVDNDVAICEHQRVPLSSVEADFFGEAYFACEQLDRLLEGEKIPSRLTHPTSVKVIARRSTASPGAGGRLVTDALELIEREATNGLTVDGVARQLGVSRPLLYLRFHEAGAPTVNDSIQARKFREVAHLLRTTGLTLETIADQCGFRNLSYMMTEFKRRFGMRP